MNIQLLVIFVTLSIINVILQTVKSIATVKCGKSVAAVVNAIAFGLYTIVTVYTMCDLPLIVKAGVVAVCNLVGVYVVKLIEEKCRRDKIWKVECTINKLNTFKFSNDLLDANIPCNWVSTSGKWDVFNIFCRSQKESVKVKEIINKYSDAHYFVTESKVL